MAYYDMIFNEISTAGLRRALGECGRVLRPAGLLLITITHPQFIASLDRRNQLKRNKFGTLTMPGAGGLRLPVAPRRLRKYERLLSEAGFEWDKSNVYVTEKVLREKPGLRSLGNKPLALILRGRRI